MNGAKQKSFARNADSERDLHRVRRRECLSILPLIQRMLLEKILQSDSSDREAIRAKFARRAVHLYALEIEESLEKPKKTNELEKTQ
jgi:hypothetical protein